MDSVKRIPSGELCQADYAGRLIRPKTARLLRFRERPSGAFRAPGGEPPPARDPGRRAGGGVNRKPPRPAGRRWRAACPAPGGAEAPGDSPRDWGGGGLPAPGFPLWEPEFAPWGRRFPPWGPERPPWGRGCQGPSLRTGPNLPYRGPP
jgi:hypothetical protein